MYSLTRREEQKQEDSREEEREREREREIQGCACKLYSFYKSRSPAALIYTSK